MAATMLALSVGLSSCTTQMPAWRPIVDVDFAHVMLQQNTHSDDWLVRFGVWRNTKDGLHKIGAAQEGGLLLRLPVVAGAIRVEYEAMSPDPCDMSLFLGVRAFDGNVPAGSAFFGAGTRGNVESRIVLPDGTVTRNSQARLTPSQWHRIAVERAGGQLRLEIDGKEAVRVTDPKAGFAGPFLMLYAYGDTVFRSVRILTRRDSVLNAHLPESVREREKCRQRQAKVPIAAPVMEAKPSNFGITDRGTIFAKLRSFDHQGLSAGEFEQQALALLTEPYRSAEVFHRAFLARRHGPPPEQPANVKLAEEILANTFTFYGETHALGNTIRWEENPGTDHWGHDLNRFSYLPVLCDAARETGDPRYIEKATALVLDWVAATDVCDAPEWDGNKQRSPYVWQSYLNIAIHLNKWTAHIDQLAPAMTPTQLLQVMKSIHDQMAWLEAVIPTRVNNWVVIGSGDMVTTAARLRELRDSGRWFDFAWNQLQRTAAEQILPDGVQFELTPGYHLVVARRYATAIQETMLAGAPVPAWVAPVLEGMLDYTIQTVTPTDNLLGFNDSDPDSANGARDLLTEMAGIMHRPDWLYVGTRGAQGRAPDVRSQAFEYGGVYVMRTGWVPDSSYLAFDGGPWGASHQHDDKLSFVLTGLGRSFIVDPGRYLYDTHNSFSHTNYLGTSFAHSTITVDGGSQADRYFQATHRPGPRLVQNQWEDRPGHGHVRARHELGYGPKGKTLATHTRDIHFWHPDVVLVLDHVDGEGRHNIESRLQFAPGELILEDGVWHTTYDDVNLAVRPWMSAPFTSGVKQGALNPARGWYSSSYGQITASPTLEIATTSDLPLRGAFLMVMYAGGTPPVLNLQTERNQLVAIVGGKRYACSQTDE